MQNLRKGEGLYDQTPICEILILIGRICDTFSKPHMAKPVRQRLVLF